MIPVVLTSLEVRYEFSSIQLGMIPSAFDITVVISVVFISYFGGNSHKPRWLAVGLFIMGLGSLLFALPQFITGEYEVGRTTNLTFEACRDVNDFSPDCDEESDSIYAVFILGSMLLGVGSTPLFTIGTSYIEDIIHPKYSPIWLGIFYTCVVVGPAIGFGLGGVFLTMYVDPSKDTTLKDSDPGWVGAWWIGFIVCGILCLMISILFLMFPEKYPNTDSITEERVKLASIQRNKTIRKEDLNIKIQVKELPKHIIDLLARVPYLLVTLTFTCFALFSAVLSFIPKYVEAQFGVTSSTASLLSGAVSIPSGIIGIMLGVYVLNISVLCIKIFFLGALLIFFLKPTAKRLSLYFFILNVIGSIFFAGFLLRCPSHDIAGVSVSYPNRYIYNN